MKSFNHILTMLIVLTTLGCNKENDVDFGDDQSGGGSNSVNGTTWNTITKPGNDIVEDIDVINGKVIVAFSYYNGSSFAQSGEIVGGGVTPYYNNLGSGFGFDRFKVIDGELYACGLYSYYGCFKFLEDTKGWSSVATNKTPSGSYTSISDVEFYNGQIVKANGHDPFVEIGSGDVAMGSGLNDNVECLQYYNGDLIAGGSFDSTGNGTYASCVARWNGTDWEAMGDGLQGGTVFDMAVYDSKLIATGTFKTTGGKDCRFIAQWDGTTWSDLGGSLTGGFNGGRDVEVYGGELFVGGDFTFAGPKTSPYLARWNGTSWGTVPAGIPAAVGSIAGHDGKLYISNAFYSSGNNFLMRLD